MICNITYSTMTELTCFVSAVKKLHDKWPKDYWQVVSEFDDLAYDLFVTRGVPFTEVVQFMQEFGSSRELENVAHELLTPKVSRETEEGKEAELVMRRDAMRRLVSFFNALMSLSMTRRRGEQEEKELPILVTPECAAGLFSLNVEQFMDTVSRFHIPSITIGQNEDGSPITRFSPETLKMLAKVATNAYFLDRNSFIYQRNIIHYPEEADFVAEQLKTIRENDAAQKQVRREKQERLQQRSANQQNGQKNNNQNNQNRNNAQKAQNNQNNSQQKPRQNNRQEKKPYVPVNERPTFRKEPVDARQLAAEAEKKEAERKAQAEAAKAEAPKPEAKAEPKPAEAPKPEALKQDAKPVEKPAEEPAKESEMKPAIGFAQHKPQDEQKNEDFGNVAAKDESDIVDDLLSGVLEATDATPQPSPEEKEKGEEGEEETPSSDWAHADPGPKNDDVEALDTGLAMKLG